MKYVQRHHPEEQIIGDRDEDVQTRRRISITPKRKAIALLVGIYRVSSLDRTPKGHRSQPDHRSIHQYFVRG